MMGRLYENPPLIEAVCEFRFEPDQPWDWTIPGLVYDKVKKEFPKKKQLNVLEVGVHADPEVSQSVKGAVARMQFLSEDENAFIQVGRNLLGVNHLQPYPTWGKFQKMIKNGLAVYREVAYPKAINRIGLRYINRLEIPKEQVKIEDYILAMPTVPQPVPQIFARWLQRVEIPFEDVNGLMVIQSGSLDQDDPEKILFILDLDFITLDVRKINLDDTFEWVTQAHDEIEKTFESCITDKMRALFKEVRNG